MHTDGFHRWTRMGAYEVYGISGFEGLECNLAGLGYAAKTFTP